ncbi:MAG: endonuclease III domain-containing protein [Syntrophobacterales bacterium]|jgi:endonuclease-3 related protein|nr:endonuclease III domain-containing protein [Syntrophobacterales bacterium]
MSTQERLLKIFSILLGAFGERHWWPGDTPLEIIVGAVLTQNTSWKNVAKAIGNMKANGIMDITKLYEIDPRDLADTIRPSGFFNIKSKRLKNVINFIYDQFDGTIENLRTIDTERLRKLLLGINGMGPETVDSILLYALDRPIFVIDAYTKRFLKNHRLYADRESYNDLQDYFQGNLPCDTYLYNEYHALIVVLCQTYCKKDPLCGDCPLKDDLDLHDNLVINS